MRFSFLLAFCTVLLQTNAEDDVIEVFFHRPDWKDAFIYYTPDGGKSYPHRRPGKEMMQTPFSSGLPDGWHFARLSSSSSVHFTVTNGEGDVESPGDLGYYIDEGGAYTLADQQLSAFSYDADPLVYSLDSAGCSIDGGVCSEITGELRCTGDCQSEVPDLLLHASTNAEGVRILIKSQTQKRWEVPHPKRQEPKNVHKLSVNTRAAAPPPSLEYTEEPFEMSMKREEGAPHSFASFSDFHFQDRDIQFTLTLPNEDTAANYVYGWGTRKGMLRLDANPHRSGYTIYNSDAFKVPAGEVTYGSHPFLLIKDNDGSWYGVFLLNSNANDIKFEEGGKLAFRLSGGIIDLQVFLGPTAKEVLAQYHNHIGLPMLPPMWSLGYHQCQWGFKSADDVMNEVEKHEELNIPLDGIWNDIDYMDNYKDFTLGERYNEAALGEVVQRTHDLGKRMVFIKDPVIAIEDDYAPYTLGKEMDIFMKDFRGEDLVSKQWPGLVHTPDFFNPTTAVFWTQMLSDFHDLTAFDGIWLDMNEPSSFCPGEYLLEGDMDLGPGPEDCELSNYDLQPRAAIEPTFTLQEQEHVVSLNKKTLATDAKNYEGETMYNLHCVFAHVECRVTYDALASIQGKRPFILTRDTFSGTGQYAAHWTGDEFGSWKTLKTTVQSVLSMQLFGIPMTGSDIPGLEGAQSPHLFVRWMQLGSFYPFMRNHHDLIRSPHTSMINWDETTRNRALRAIRVRYSLLPLWYTNFYLAHSRGGGVVQPLFMEFRDDASLDVTNAFLIGEQLMVAPALGRVQTEVMVHLPPASQWFSFHSGDAMVPKRHSTRVKVPASLDDDVPLFIRGGCIVPSQEPALTAMAAFETPMTLTVAMNRDGKATGQMFHDDGEALDSAEMDKHNFMEFAAEVAEGKLTVRSSVLSENPDHRMERSLKAIRVYGIEGFVCMSCSSTIAQVELSIESLGAGVIIVFQNDFHFGVEWRLDCVSTAVIA